MQYSIILVVAAALSLGPQAAIAVNPFAKLNADNQRRQIGSLGIDDTATAVGCGTATCCEPACEVQVNDVLGCTGRTDWSSSCIQNYNTPGGSQGIGGCSGFTMDWSNDGGNHIRITNSAGSYQDFYISDCQTAGEDGQCTSSGGGCTAQATF